MIKSMHPEVDAMQMENFTVHALAQISTNHDVFASSVSIVTMNLFDSNVIPLGKLAELEDLSGNAICKGLVDFDFPEGEPAWTVEIIKTLKK